MSTHCLSLTLINSEVNKETRKTVFVSISKQAATFPSLDDFVIQVFCTEMKQHFTETWISRAIFYIIGLTALSKSTSKVKTVTKLLKSFTDKLKIFLQSHKFLLESERSNKKDSSVENKGPQSEPCGSLLSSFNSKNFTDLLEKLERSNILRHIFLHPDHSKSISELVNELIVEVLCLYFQTYPESSSSFYKDKLISVMARSFLNESQLEDDNLTELVFSCFFKIHPWLDQSHLVEVNFLKDLLLQSRGLAYCYLLLLLIDYLTLLLNLCLLIDYLFVCFIFSLKFSYFCFVTFHFVLLFVFFN